jgi:hypothetical protein
MKKIKWYLLRKKNGQYANKINLIVYNIVRFLCFKKRQQFENVFNDDFYFWGDFRSALKLAWRVSHCKHKFTCETHITEDAGFDEITCTKCGQSMDVIYY